VRLWDAQTGRPIGAPLLGHTGATNSVAFAIFSNHKINPVVAPRKQFHQFEKTSGTLASSRQSDDIGQRN